MAATTPTPIDRFSMNRMKCGSGVLTAAELPGDLLSAEILKGYCDAARYRGEEESPHEHISEKFHRSASIMPKPATPTGQPRRLGPDDLLRHPPALVPVRRTPRQSKVVNDFDAAGVERDTKAELIMILGFLATVVADAVANGIKGMRDQDQNQVKPVEADGWKWDGRKWVSASGDWEWDGHKWVRANNG